MRTYERINKSIPCRQGNAALRVPPSYPLSSLKRRSYSLNTPEIVCASARLRGLSAPPGTRLRETESTSARRRLASSVSIVYCEGDELRMRMTHARGAFRSDSTSVLFQGQCNCTAAWHKNTVVEIDTCTQCPTTNCPIAYSSMAISRPIYSDTFMTLVLAGGSDALLVLRSECPRRKRGLSTMQNERYIASRFPRCRA